MCIVHQHQWCSYRYIGIVAMLGHYTHTGIVDFQWPLCRLDLQEDIVQSIAYTFAKQPPGDLLTEFRKHLPVADDDRFNDLVVDLLNRNEFNLDKTYDCMFNIVGLVEPSPNESLNTAKKTVFLQGGTCPC